MKSESHVTVFSDTINDIKRLCFEEMLFSVDELTYSSKTVTEQ